jgi:hypothetical protein
VLIETAQQLPSIQELEIVIKITGYRCGTGHMGALRIARSNLAAAVSSFSPGPVRSNMRYPTIVVMEWDKYTMSEEDDGWKYRSTIAPSISFFGA